MQTIKLPQKKENTKHEYVYHDPDNQYTFNLCMEEDIAFIPPTLFINKTTNTNSNNNGNILVIPNVTTAINKMGFVKNNYTFPIADYDIKHFALDKPTDIVVTSNKALAISASALELSNGENNIITQDGTNLYSVLFRGKYVHGYILCTEEYYNQNVKNNSYLVKNKYSTKQINEICSFRIIEEEKDGKIINKIINNGVKAKLDNTRVFEPNTCSIMTRKEFESYNNQKESNPIMQYFRNKANVNTKASTLPTTFTDGRDGK